MNNQTINTFLLQLGLNNDEVVLFESLVEKGSQTILQLSRNTQINRTKVYRILEEMKRCGLVEDVVDENRWLAKAIDLAQLDLLVRDAELKARALREAFPLVSHLISSSRETHQPGTRVVFHRGVDGIKQMVWNTLAAKTEVVGYTYRRLDEIVGDKFSREWHEEWIRRDLKMRDIYSDEYLKSFKKNRPETNNLRHFESRYISSKIVNINHQMDIYEDTVAYYNWYEGEVFGVEINNKKIATMQRQLFEITWKISST